MGMPNFSFLKVWSLTLRAAEEADSWVPLQTYETRMYEGGAWGLAFLADTTDGFLYTLELKNNWIRCSRNKEKVVQAFNFSREKTLEY